MSNREKVINDQQNQIEELEKRLAMLLEDHTEIVRCNDCKKHDTYDCTITYLTMQKTPNDWYCADGERKEGR